MVIGHLWSHTHGFARYPDVHQGIAGWQARIIAFRWQFLIW